MPTLTVVTDLPADVATSLAVSLDLDVERAAGRRHRVHPVPAGPGSRTSGRIGEGERVRWSLRLYGLVPMAHTTCIETIEEVTPSGGARFVDTMVSGAFASFRHEHLLEPLAPPATAQAAGTSGDAPATRMTDAMAWRSPLGVLGRLADVLFVRATLAGLLADRNAEVLRRLARA